MRIRFHFLRGLTGLALAAAVAASITSPAAADPAEPPVLEGTGVLETTAGPRVDLTPQIYNSTAAAWADHAEIAQILWQGRMMCGGTFLSDSWVLTAAHCVKASVAEDAPGAADGVYEINPRDVSPRIVSVRSVSGTHTVDRVVPNPDYGEIHAVIDEKTSLQYLHHDMALVHLSTPARGVAHATLAASDADYSAATPLMAYGWGDTDPDDGTSYPAVLQATRPNMLFPVGAAYPACDPYAPLIRPEPTILCVYATGQAGAGGGDSGGPWYVRGADGVDRQVGVTSFGPSTGYPTQWGPAYAAAVPAMHPWIQSVTGAPEPEPGAPGSGSLGSLGSLFGS